MSNTNLRRSENPFVGTQHIRKAFLKRWVVASIVSAMAFCGSSSHALLAQFPSAVEQPEFDGVYWSRLDFVIPFNVDLTGQAPREIQLEYSSDGGTNWGVYSRSDVRTKQFQFQAKSDGEYQFRLKTIDKQGRLFDNPGEPLKVYVDTTKPEGNLIIDIDQRGTMLAEFSLMDIAIDAESVQLTYQTEALSQPRAIEFELAEDREPGKWIGKGSWSIPSGTKQLAVRLVAKDKAGNTLEVNRLPQLPRSASVNSSLQLASGRSRENNSQPAIGTGVAEATKDSLPKIEVLSGPGARHSGNMNTQLTAQIVEQQQMLIKHQQQLLDQQISANKQLTSGGLFGTGPNGKQFNEDAALPSPESPPAIPQHSTRQVTKLASPGENDALSIDRSTNRIPVREMTDEEYEQAAAPNNMSLVAKRSNQSLVVRESDELDLIKPSIPKLEPPSNVDRVEGQTSFRNNIKPLYSSSKAFSLDYSIENEPDSPVAAVELWGTADEGRTWQMWGTDPDRASPFDIQVESEGLFGFRMIIVGANGLASNRPRNGDNADAWIHVDTQRPRTKLVSALYGKGKEAGSMVIEYSALDEFFTDRPVTLSYSESPEGPWHTIATGIRNNGRYVWPADPSLPPSLFLQIEAHDAAGNVGVHRLDTPVDVQGLAPRGRIQGFRPIP